MFQLCNCEPVLKFQTIQKETNSRIREFRELKWSWQIPFDAIATIWLPLPSFPLILEVDVRHSQKCHQVKVSELVIKSIRRRKWTFFIGVSTFTGVLYTRNAITTCKPQCFFHFISCKMRTWMDERISMNNLSMKHRFSDFNQWNSTTPRCMQDKNATQLLCSKWSEQLSRFGASEIGRASCRERV